MGCYTAATVLLYFLQGNRHFAGLSGVNFYLFFFCAYLVARPVARLSPGREIPAVLQAYLLTCFVFAPVMLLIGRGADMFFASPTTAHPPFQVGSFLVGQLLIQLGLVAGGVRERIRALKSGAALPA